MPSFNPHIWSHVVGGEYLKPADERGQNSGLVYRHHVIGWYILDTDYCSITF